MGKTMTRDQRKNNKFTVREQNRANKFMDYETEAPKKREKPKQKWRPHSETEY